jgi:hypothetical protein
MTFTRGADVPIIIIYISTLMSLIEFVKYGEKPVRTDLETYWNWFQTVYTLHIHARVFVCNSALGDI